MDPTHADLIPLTENTECRNCHSEGGDDLIAPCHCSGSIKYVHRSCLDQWRAYSPNESSFTHCDVCHFEYRFRERPDLRASRIWRFALYVARDFFGAMILVQIIVGLLGVISWAADKGNDVLLHVFPATWSTLAVYYVWGLFFFSICASIYGFMMGMYWCCTDTSSRRSKGSSVTYDTYPYSVGYYYWWWYPYPGTYGGCCPVCDCNCGGHGHGACCSCACPAGGCGGGNCEGKDSNAMGLLAIIVLVVGIVVGVIVCTVIAALVIRNHMKILRRRQDAREMEIIDLEHDSGAGSMGDHSPLMV